MKTMKIIQDCIVIALVIIGVISIIASVFNGAMHLTFIGISALLLSYIMTENNTEEDE